MKLWVVAMLGLCAACGDGRTATPPQDAPAIDAELVDVGPDANPLASLDGTGLCADAACTQINSTALEYEPRFALWSDGATKRRWIELPAGTKIDTTDMNRWVFPVGTKLWKEFTRDGIRVETRFITKLLADDDAPGAWFFVAYAWNATQDAAVAVSTGQQNVNGTTHDIPSRANCKECHDSLRPSRVLGFQAIQLDAAAPSGKLDLDDLIAMNLLTAAPAGAASPHFALPGTAVEQAALGYMHGNCGHCHNATSPVHDTTPIETLLDTTKLATVATTPSFVSMVDQTAAVPFNDENGVLRDKIIISGDPDNSGLIVRMNTSIGIRHMPKLGSEVVDPDGQTALRAWITGL
ncbi:MAG: hypothetical protein H6Q90_4627 [Deltaproteobacteria bacterium]|nr:hypothetical protein [Deltaproteobacteria bacterium]